MAASSHELLAYERNQPVAALPEATGPPPTRGKRAWLVAGAASTAALLVAAGVAVGVTVRSGAVHDERDRATSAERQLSKLRAGNSRRQSVIAEQQRRISRLEEQLRRQQQPAQPTHPAAADAATSFGDGIYQLGVAIQPGRYRTDGTGTCYWAKLSTGDTNKVIVSSYRAGPQTVTIDSPYFESEACGTWTKVG